MEALDIYTLNTTTPPAAGAVTAGPAGAPAAATPAIGGTGGAIAAQQRAVPLQQAVRTKEEKEVLEHFAGVFGLLHPQTFKEVFTQTIDYVVERIYKNYASIPEVANVLGQRPHLPTFGRCGAPEASEQRNWPGHIRGEDHCRQPHHRPSEAPAQPHVDGESRQQHVTPSS